MNNNTLLIGGLALLGFFVLGGKSDDTGDSMIPPPPDISTLPTQFQIDLAQGNTINVLGVDIPHSYLLQNNWVPVPGEGWMNPEMFALHAAGQSQGEHWTSVVNTSLDIVLSNWGNLFGGGN